MVERETRQPIALCRLAGKLAAGAGCERLGGGWDVTEEGGLKDAFDQD